MSPAAAETAGWAERCLVAIRVGGRQREAGVRVLYEHLAQSFLNYFRSHRLTDDDSADVLQETFVKIIRATENYRGQGKAESWMWQIARNCLNDFHRGSNRRQSEISMNVEDWETLAGNTESPGPPNPLESVDECVARAMGRFLEDEPKRMEALVLWMESGSMEEISVRIGRTVAATKEFLSQCRKKLKPYLVQCHELLVSDQA